jgi:glycolate dehydrogenase iron-sulfur subunit
MRARVCSSPRLTILVWSTPGGSFGLSYYETSNKIVDPKAVAIRETDAEAVVTTCPGCRMQIIDSLRRQGLPQPVLHLIHLLEPDDSQH